MKALTTYINEKLVLNKDTFKKPEYKYFPETKEELNRILKQLLTERKDDDIINLNDIDTSKITDMSDLFKEKEIKNIDISNWNMSKVKNIDRMFFRCYTLNYIGDISDWDVSNVETMHETFLFCQNLKSVGNLFKWNVSKVTDMKSMFSHCNNLKSVGDLSKWNVSKVTSMDSMFYECENIVNIGDISNWNIHKLKPKDMLNMFLGSKITNIPKWYKG